MTARRIELLSLEWGLLVLDRGIRLMHFRSIAFIIVLFGDVSGCAFDPSGSAAPGPGDMTDPGEGPVQAPGSCAEILADGSTSSGVYQIDPGGAGAFSAYCDMESDGGGWTLALKADGEKSTFRYLSLLWTSTELLAPDRPDLDRNEAKLQSFNRVSFAEVLVRFDTQVEGDDDEDTHLESHSVRVDVQGESLLALFAPEEYVPVDAGRDAWLDAIPSSSLPEDCEEEGINAGASYNRVRLGMVANDGDDCDTLDSKLGVGNSFACDGCVSCDDEGPAMAGPAAGNNDGGCQQVVSFASVFVR